MGLEFQYEEGNTPLDEEEKEGLKIQAITHKSELNEWEQANIENALLWLRTKRSKKESILSERFIKTLHKRMFGDVWKWAGNFRKSEKNIGVAWIHIATELRKLIDDTLFWIENDSYEAAEIAIRFKHRLVSIHCFPNGNGRHSRLMADIIISKIMGEREFTWHQESTLASEQIRAKYITSLKEADKGSFIALIKFAQG